MKTNFTRKLKAVFALVALAVTLLGIVDKADAQGVALEGGRTYYINGIGTDLASPKDTFVSIRSIFDTINKYGTDFTTSGTVTILLAPYYSSSSYVETGPMVLGSATNGGYPSQSSNRPIVLKPATTTPATDFTITCTTISTANAAVIRLNGIQYFTIDGEGTSGQKNIIVKVPSASTTAIATSLKAIEIQNPTSSSNSINITVQNCKIIGNSSTSAVNTFAGIYVGSAGAAPPANNLSQSVGLKFEKNVITAVQTGILVRGMAGGASAKLDRDLSIKGNIIGGQVAPGGSQPTDYIGGAPGATYASSGIYITAQTNANIEGNIIRNSFPSVAASFRGIAVTADAQIDSVITITKNQIYNINYTGATASIGVYGIQWKMTGSHPSLNSVITNNTIANLSSATATSAIANVTFPIGISVEEGTNTSNVGLTISNNSINLYGSTMVAATGITGSLSACVAFSSNVTGGITLTNNILANRMGRLSSNTNNSTSYGVIVNATTADPFTVCNGNNYFVSTKDGGNAYLAWAGGKTRPSLNSWRAFTGDDNSSISAIPPFKSDTLLQLDGTTPSAIAYSGITGTGVTVDINGNARSTIAPSIGAYEFTALPGNVNSALVGGGTYTIGGTAAWPVGGANSGTFATLGDAINYLNAYGTSGTGTVTLSISTSYTNEGSNNYLPAFIDYPNASSTRPVLITPASGATPTLTIPNVASPINAAVLYFIGTSNLTVDGNNALTIAIPASATNTNNNSRVISISPLITPSTDLAIKNCTITGSTTGSPITAVNTFAGIYLGSDVTGSTPAGAAVGSNNNLVFTGNTIQGVRTGIYLRSFSGAQGVQSQNITVSGNTIGGSTPNIGGTNGMAGIYLRSIAAATVSNNIIKNNIPAISNDFRGIDLDAVSGDLSRDTSITVSANKIYNLTSTGTNCIGIKVNLVVNDSFKNITLINNFIGKIQGIGGTTQFSTSNPAGILIDASGIVNSVGITMYYNTINLSGNSLTSNTGASTALYIAGNVRGGVTLKNNLLVNRLGRSAFTFNSGTGAYAIQVGSAANSNPFTLPGTSTSAIGNNKYCVVGGASVIGYIGYGNGNQAISNYTGWRTYATDNGSSIENPSFTRDTMPDVDPSTYGRRTGALLGTGMTDIYGTTRPNGGTAGLPCPGAVEYGTSVPYPALVGDGVYYIDGTQVLPTSTTPGSGHFATVNRAFQYLVANGVTGSSLPRKTIKFVLSQGYNGEGDTIIIPLTDYNGATPNRPVVLTTDSTRTITGTAPHNINGSMIRISTGNGYFTIDGSKNGTNSRDLTIMLPLVDTTTAANAFTLKVVDVTPYNSPVSQVTIKNCTIQGTPLKNGTINTFAGIYMGGTTATPSNPLLSGNNNNTFTNNFIGGVKYGIHLRGMATVRGSHDMNNKITFNQIGGDIAPSASTFTKPTNYFGGADQSAGISLVAQATALVDSNIVKNNVTTFNQNRGIELATVTSGLSSDSAVSIIRNSVYKIKSTGTTGTAAWGIYVGLTGSTDTVRNNLIANNFVSRISASGTNNATAVISPLNPAGIFVDGTGSLSNIGLNIWANSINMKDTLTNNNGASSCVQFDPSIKGGVSMRNNIFQNTTRNTTGSVAAAVIVGANQDIFNGIDNNNYFCSATNGGTSNLVVYNAGASRTTVANTLTAISNYTAEDTMSMNFVTKFVSDTVLDIDLSSNTSSVLVGSGANLPGITTDIFKNPRPTAPAIGAVEFPGIYVDSITPKIYNYSQFACGNDFTVVLGVYDNGILYDTLYYTVNGVTQTPILPSINGRKRYYVLPTQPSSSLILYRVSVNDAAGFNAKFPASGAMDSIATSIIVDTLHTYGYGFDGPNVNKWIVEQISGTGGWTLNAYGSPSNPNFMTAYSGLKVAMFPASTLSNTTASRIVSPCFDMSNSKNPTLRFWISQNQDQPNLKDSVVIKVNTGSGWSLPLRSIQRVNSDPQYSIPGYRQIDVCLTDYAGATGLRVGIEGYSRAGNNILIDSVMMIDNYVNTSVTPLTNTICGNDSIRLTIANSIPTFTYRIININQGAAISLPTYGNGGNLNIAAANQMTDTVTLQIQAVNSLDQSCANLMATQANVYTKLFKNGPFVTKGTPYSGVFNTDGNDGAQTYDTLTYDIVPPSGFTNADYGTTWTVVGVTVKTGTNVDADSVVTTFPTTSSAGKVVMLVTPTDGDSLFNMRVRLRLLPTNCDSVVTRTIKITSPPAVSFVNGGKDTACQGASVNFISTTPINAVTAPYSYLWDFGDGTTSTASSVYKTYTAAGNYQVKLTVTNSVGIAAKSSKAFLVQGAPESGFDNTTSCIGDSTYFTNTTTGAVAYEWMYTSPFNSGGSFDVNPTFYFTSPTGDTATYYVSLVATNSIGCTDTTRTKVQLFIKPVASFSVTNGCMGAVVGLTNNSTITGANTIGSTWYMGNGDVVFSNNPTYRYLNNGTYDIVLKAESNYGCVDRDTQTVLIYDRPRTGFYYDINTTCQGIQVNITDTTKYEGVLGSTKALYQWNFGDQTAISNDFTPTKTYGASGTYQLKLVSMDTINFCKDSTVKSITINATPRPQFESSDKGCMNKTVNFTNKTSSGSQTYTYSWSYGDGSPADPSYHGSHVYTTSGTMRVILKAIASTGCSDTVGKDVNITPLPDAHFVYDNPNAFSARMMAVNHTYSSYVWNMGDGTPPLTAYKDTVTYTFSFKGKHAVSLVVTDNNGCVSDKFTDSVVTLTSVGIDEVANQFDLNIYPNPFTDITNINYSLDRNAKVSVKVVDLLGRVVSDIDYGTQSGGKHTIELDTDKFSVTSAAYVVRIQIGDAVITKQIIRQK